MDDSLIGYTSDYNIRHGYWWYLTKGGIYSDIQKRKVLRQPEYIDGETVVIVNWLYH